MRIVVAVDWSDETFSAVQAVTRLYQPQELVLVHAVDVRPFEDPLFAPAIAKQAYGEVRKSMVDSGEQLLARTSDLVPSDLKSVRRLCEVGAPAEVIVDTARAAKADLLVLGTRGHGRLSEVVLGSVSHQVLLRAPCSTLIVKRPLESLRRVLVPVEGPDDASLLQQWLRSHPFNHPVELSIMTAVPNPYFGDPVPAFAQAAWAAEVEKRADEFSKKIADGLAGPHYTVRNEVVRGFPTDAVTEAADQFDLVVVGSHGRKGLRRFLLGSVSHSLVHRVACPILVVRGAA